MLAKLIKHDNRRFIFNFIWDLFISFFFFFSIIKKPQPHQREFIILTFGINLCGKNWFLLKLTLK